MAASPPVDLFCDLVADLIFVHPRPDPKGRFDDVDHRKEVDDAAILDTDARENGRIRSNGVLKLVDEAALAHTGLAHNIDHLGLSFFRPIESGFKGFDLRPTTDEIWSSLSQCLRQILCEYPGARRQAKEPLRLGFALQLCLSHKLLLEKTPDEVSGFLAYPDLARLRCLLYTGCEVSRISNRCVIHPQIIPD